jgi:tetratricopeptide (TPR) repeat protein
MSERDIQPGQRWNDEISSRLRDTYFGIICLTPENLNAPWLLFEAGALAKSVDSTRVVPLLFGLRKADLTYPLAQFQAVESDKEGFFALASAVNRALGEHRLEAPVLETLFTRLWPDLEQGIRSAPAASKKASGPAARPDREILEDVLNGVRGIQRALGSRSRENAATNFDAADWEDYYLRGVHLANSRAGVEANMAALRAYSEAIALAPTSLPQNTFSRLYAYRGAILKRLRRLDEAESDVALAQRWATEDREIEDAAYNRACVLALKGDVDGALGLLEVLVGRNPRWAQVARNKVEYFGALRDIPRFEKLTARRSGPRS